MPDWIPQRKAEYRDFVQNFINTVSLVPADYNFLAADITDLSGAANPWISAYNTRIAAEAALAAAVLDENALQDALDVVLREKNLKVQAPPPVSDAKKAAAGFPVRDTNPTPRRCRRRAPFVSRVEVRASGG